MKLTIGTRGSALALAQSEHMRARLLALDGVNAVELRIIKTRGDKILDVALNRVGGKGLFVKELEEALLDGSVDLAVHSLKDMPSVLPPGLCLGAIPEREDARDAWVRPAGQVGQGLEDLPSGAIVGTSSLRRQAQILAARPDLRVIPLRGNVDTRLAKLDSGVDAMAAIVLASAGLKRLGRGSRITRPLHPYNEMVPAVGQGALAIECREEDPPVRELLARLDDADARTTVAAERGLLEGVQGGCQVPVGGHAVLEGAQLHLWGMVATLDGATVLRDELRGPRSDAEALGRALATRLLGAGAREILDAIARAEAAGGERDAPR